MDNRLRPGVLHRQPRWGFAPLERRRELAAVAQVGRERAALPGAGADAHAGVFEGGDHRTLVHVGGGEFDRRTGHYERNVVVFAVPA